MKGLKIAVGLLVIAILTGIGYSQTQWVWRVLPYSEFGRSTSPTSGLVPNNGWAIAKPYSNPDPSEIHVVFTSNLYYYDKTKPRGYWSYSTNRGRNWSTPYCLSGEKRSFGDSAKDASIACLGDTIALAFYDFWNGDSNYNPNQIAYTHKVATDDWINLQPLIHERDHVGARHPSLALEYESDPPGDWRLGAHILFSMYRSDPLWIWCPAENHVDILPEFDVGWEIRLGSIIGDSVDFMTVSSDAVRDDHNYAHYFALEKLNDDETYDIWCGKKDYLSGVRALCLTSGSAMGRRPSIQTVAPDTFAVAYQRKEGNKYRIYVAVVNADDGLRIIENDPAFPNEYIESGDSFYPNLWNSGDTLYMAYTKSKEGGQNRFYVVYFSYSTNRGRDWVPVGAVSVFANSASLTAERRHAYVVYSFKYPLTSDTQSLRFREVRAVPKVPPAEPPVKVDGISPATARVLQQLQSPSNCLYRAYPVEDFIAVDRSTDNGLTWEDIFSPGWGKNPAIATDGDSAVAAFFVEGCSLYCAWWYPSVMDWTQPQVVFAGVEGEVPLNPSVALYPGDVAGMKVAGVAFAVYDTVEGTSRIMFAKVDTGTVILDTIVMQE
ncbi:MAG: hypothetical protein ABIK42_05605 [candidate division WOR-3 bacterium]